MKVALIRNLHEHQNVSMKLTADRLEHALQGRAEFVNVHPWWPTQLSPDSAGGKFAGYVSRYALYPRSVTKVHADVYHIIDHAYAQVGRHLPADRTVVTCHDLMLLQLQRGHFGKRPVPSVAAGLFRASADHLRRARHIVAVSEATSRDLVELLSIDPERIRVIYPPLDPLYRRAPASLCRKQLRRELGLPDSRIVFHLGNNWFYKNVDGVLRGFAVVATHLDNVILLKGGKPFSREQRELARTLGIADRVIECGPLITEHIQRYYWAADVLLFPSLWEGFGWPPVEAMASGIPVVCSRAGALAEAAGDAAEFVDPNSPEDIGRGVIRVLEDSSYRANLVERGFANARRFNAARISQQWLDVYCDLADVRRSEAICVE